MKTIIRWALLIAVLAGITSVALFFRQVGLGEWGILLAILAWVIAVESILYISRRFLKEYRRGATDRTKRRN